MKMKGCIEPVFGIINDHEAKYGNEKGMGKWRVKTYEITWASGRKISSVANWGIRN
jgi:hypothetical protein